ncbi:hypothetical protein [Plantactinospora sp. KBS50]|uniref:hypothetical protein n=1 Tax=Plantactinospora sp. KBS50 TaxID=2024580 RepID=UPI0012FE3ACC|nr:hypothetical protein [Plantactinospora sp. KBS50]
MSTTLTPTPGTGAGVSAAVPGVRRADEPAGLRARIRGGLRDTPRRLAAVLAGLVALGILVGAIGFAGVRQRAALIDGVTSRSGPLVVAAQDLYRALSDADATAASAFLSGGVEPAAQRERYQRDLSQATAALSTLTAGRAGEELRTDTISVLASGLPMYAGLIETARSYNRQGLPVGAAYLREASGLMRERLLPAALLLYRTVSGELREARSGAASFPWFAVLLGVLAVAALVAAQRWLTRRTNRVFNVGLLIATAAVVALIGWLGTSAVVTATRLSASDRDGSAQVDRLVQARAAALQARADESLTLVARGGGAEFEEDYTLVLNRLIGTDGQGGLLRAAADGATDPGTRAAARDAAEQARAWLAAHQKLRQLDDNGGYTEAVQAVVGDGPEATTTIFNELDQVLADAIVADSDRFAAHARSAGRALSGVDIGVLALALIMVLGVAVGIQRRLAEYR